MECKNVGVYDQIFRITISIVLFVIGAFYLKEYALIISSIIALIILTSLFQYCPLYQLFGINTCENRRSKTVKEARKNMIQGQTTKSKKLGDNYKKDEKKAKSSKKRKAKTKKTKKKIKRKKK